MDQAVIINIGDPNAYANTMCLGRCIEFGKTLLTWIWNGLDGK